MNKARILINKSVLLLCLCIASCFILGIGKIEDKDSGKIHKNIYIEKLNVGKLNIDEAKKIVNNHYNIKPIQIKYDKKIWTINPKDIDLAYNSNKSIKKAYEYTRTTSTKENIKRTIKLNFKETYNIKLKATYNEVKLSELIAVISKEMNIKDVEATLEIKDNSQIITTDSKEGREVDVIKLKEEIYNMIDDKKVKDIMLPVNITKPNITTKDVKSINTVLGQYSTSFNNHSSRGSNIYIAAKSTSNILIMPGEVFSYNKATGARNWVNGYKTAKVIVGGKFIDGEGGGVCQVSTTIYNAALLAGLNIVEVNNHTYPSKYAPKGRDAAVSYGYTDLKFVNCFTHPIYIKNIVNNGAITSKIYGCNEDREKLYIKVEEKYEKNNINIKTYRIYFDEENNKIQEELVKESKYKMK
ncbi:VanW family protein [Romboutsia sp.]|uniref:VanW family protein n=1 Tax=Romboutsia sp. TaxID=1965302 RepID=UPI003F2B4B5C